MFLSTQENTKAFIGNLSVVVHSSNKTRLTCANFTLQGTHMGSGGSRPDSSSRSSPVSVQPVVVTAGPPIVIPLPSTANSGTAMA
jgi:hypothetical protein